MRESGSQIVVDTIENALRWGGFKLFDERFQFDSSVNWVFSESLEGELDALIPAWDRNGHVIFVQPGIVFWSGIEDEKRIDGNLGAVYRTEVFDGIVGGVNLFYDNDFKMGHSRISVGVDVQKDDFYGAFNYYAPLTDTQDGREGYVEDALEGMDAILGIESEVARFSGNVGYWNYQGEEDVEDEMEFSYGIDGGIRIFPGFFLEGSLQHHDDASLGRRASIGVAVRFSLPDLTGKSYGNSGGVSNLYKFVERERRILYEERESHGIFLLPEGSVVEGGTVNVAIQLRKTATENVIINLVGSGSATYGTDGDWTISVGGEDCAAVTGTSCSVTVEEGETMPADNVVITINNDGRGEGAETIVLSTVVASGDASLTSRPLVLTIPVDPPLPTVSLSASSAEITEGGMATLTLTLNEMLEENATFNLIGSGGAEYGTSADWNLSVGGTDCDMASESNPCEVMIAMGDTTAEVIVEVNTDSVNESSPENFTVSVVVASGSTSIVQEGGLSSLNFTIPADPPLPTVSLSADKTTLAEGETATITVTLSETLGREATFTLTGSDDDAGYSSLEDYHFIESGANCSRACLVTIPANQTSFEITVNVNMDSMNETAAETFTASLTVNQSSQDIVQLGSPSTLDFTIPAEAALPTVSWRADATSIAEGNTATITFTLSEALGGNATFNLNSFSLGRAATYGTSADWNLSVGGTDCPTATLSSPCKVTITQGQTTAEVIVKANTDMDVEMTENITINVQIDSMSRSIVALGSSGTLQFTIEDPPLPALSFNYSGASTVSAGDTVQIPIQLNSPLSRGINLHFIDGGTATYGASSGDWNVRVSFISSSADPNDPINLKMLGITPCAGVTGTSCGFTWAQGVTHGFAEIEIHSGATSGGTIEPSIVIPMEFRELVQFDSSSSPTLTIQ